MAIKIKNNEIPCDAILAKRWCREAVKKEQSRLTDDYMAIASDKIREQLMHTEEWRKARTVMLYVNVGKEVVTTVLMDVASRQRKKVCLPLCIDTENHIQEARLWDAEHRLVDGAYNIPTPANDSPVVDPQEIDLVVLPCVSCDEDCNRIGHGAGYYDRYIELLRDDCYKVALCYEEMLSEEIPIEAHDKKVDAVITEKNIYRRK